MIGYRYPFSVYISFAYKGICSAIAVIYRLSQKMDCRWFFMKLCWYLKFNEFMNRKEQTVGLLFAICLKGWKAPAFLLYDFEYSSL